jgi:hypothetical protein
MVKRALLLSLALAGCFPPPLDETGKRCAVDRPCGDGFTCFDFFCQPNDRIDAGPSNWVVNPNFEILNDAGRNVASWRGVNGNLDPETNDPHEGMYSVRLFSNQDGGETPSLVPVNPPVSNTLAGQTWCAHAWARVEGVGDAGLQVALFIRERHDDGGTNESTPPRPRIYREWAPLEERFVTEGAARMDLRITFGRQARKGEAVVVDQVRLKRSADGVCRW